jgi:hypothetical protein
MAEECVGSSSVLWRSPTDCSRTPAGNLRRLILPRKRENGSLIPSVCCDPSGQARRKTEGRHDESEVSRVMRGGSPKVNLREFIGGFEHPGLAWLLCDAEKRNGLGRPADVAPGSPEQSRVPRAAEVLMALAQ